MKIFYLLLLLPIYNEELLKILILKNDPNNLKYLAKNYFILNIQATLRLKSKFYLVFLG